MWLYKYDENYNYIPGAEIEIEDGFDIPNEYTKNRPADGLYKGKYDPKQEKWIESATKEYIESIQNELNPDTIELLKQQNSMLTIQVVQLTKDAAEAKNREAQMAKQFAQMNIEIQSLKEGDL